MVEEKAHTELWDLLKEVPDPEIPIINLVELGVVRDVQKEENGQIIVTITPTYTACPAKKFFEVLILEKLHENGFEDVKIITQLKPVWTTDWLSEETREKLMKDGISPPTANDSVIQCPNCRSENTEAISKYGSVPCQSLYKCLDCLEPFSYFKCHR